MSIDTMLCRIEIKPERVLGGVSIRLFELVCKEFPDYVTKYGWGFVGVPHNDPLVKRFLEFASDIGLDLPSDRSRMNTGIVYSVYRSDQKEFQLQAVFTSPALVGAIVAEAGFRNNGELIIVNNTRLKKSCRTKIGGIFAYPNIIVVRGDMKEEISNAGLVGLALRPLALSSTDPSKGDEFSEIDWPEEIEPLYQISSEFEFPPCKNWMFDNAGRVFYPSDREMQPDGYLPLNGLERTGALHYAKEEIAPYLDFDVVKTYEHFSRNQPEILVSRRFREVFRKLGIKGMKYDSGFYAMIDESPWGLGTDGPRHPRYSGPIPNSPVD